LFRVGKDKDGRIHPTQKPIALYDWVFERHSSAGQIVLDTHLGSGSSRIAAHKDGLEFVGFEVEADYLSASNARFDAYLTSISLDRI
jgi:site-specific DNA-methyltransferase (adenine-specific)